MSLRRCPWIVAAFALFAIATLVSADDFALQIRALPPTEHELNRPAKRNQVFADRKAYWNDDSQGQFLVMFEGEEIAGSTVALELVKDGTNVTQAVDLPKLKATTAKFSFLIDMDLLKPGRYSLGATLTKGDGSKIVATPAAFVREDKASAKIAIPADGIPLRVEEQKWFDTLAWPISTGAPLPSGAVHDVSELTVLENGKSIPAQWAVRSTWSPGLKDKPASIRWVALDFVARYDKGRPRDYRIKIGAPQPLMASQLTVKQTADGIDVDTGVVKFHVNRKRFTGIDAAWLDLNKDGVYSDDELIIKAPGAKDAKTTVIPMLSGPFLIDGRQNLYLASNDTQPDVTVEEAGPVRVTIVARGWYANPAMSELAFPKLCQFVTRLTAYANRPNIDIDQRTILTFDTRTNKLADVGFAVPVVKTKQWITSIDGKTHLGDLVKTKNTWIHQESWDRVRLASGDKPIDKPTVEGKRSDGWMTAAAPTFSVTGLLRDIWQKFPKEMEVDDTGLKLHFWPRHGRHVFEESESLNPGEIYKLLYAHDGRMLDLPMPKAMYEMLHDIDDNERWDVENTIDHGYVSNGRGVAIGNDFSLLLAATPNSGDTTKQAGLLEEGEHLTPAGDLSKHGGLFQQGPHAIAAGEWNVAAGFDSPMSARDDQHFPEAERLLNEAYPRIMHGITDHTAEYGMWIYGNTHNGWQTLESRARLHRVWQNSHYQQVGLPWLLYFRGGPFDFVHLGRAQTDNWMDVATVNYADPKDPVAFRTLGSMLHVKAFVPWGARLYGQNKVDTDGGIWGHWVDPDAYMWRYLIEGSGRAGEMYRTWGQSLGTQKLPYGPGREATNTIAMVLNYYRMTWDPQMIPYFDDLGDACLSIPFQKYLDPYGFPVWAPTWMDRYWDLTRDTRLIDRLRNYIADGFNQYSTNAFFSRATGEKEHTLKMMPQVYDMTRKVYYNNEDWLDGFGAHVAQVNTRYVRMLPYYLGQLRALGIEKLEPGEDKTAKTTYPVSSSHLGAQTQHQEISLYVLALKPDDREFTLHVEGDAAHPGEIFVIAPSGKIVTRFYSGDHHATRLTGKNAVNIKIPPDGETGVYTLELFGHQPIYGAPLTDLPHEIALFPKLAEGRAFRGTGRIMGTLGIPANHVVTMKFDGSLVADLASACYVNIRDASGKALLDTSLLVGSKRPSASVELRAGPALTLFSVYQVSDYYAPFRWDGDAPAVYFARNAADIEAILKAKPSGLPTKPKLN